VSTCHGRRHISSAHFSMQQTIQHLNLSNGHDQSCKECLAHVDPRNVKSHSPNHLSTISMHILFKSTIEYVGLTCKPTNPIVNLNPFEKR
jgi:hypothetical protein